MADAPHPPDPSELEESEAEVAADRKAEGREELESSTRRWMLAGLVLMGLLVLAFPVYRLYEPEARADARVEQTSFLAAQGADLYEGSCASCHGAEGTGAIAPAIGSLEFLQAVDDTQISQLVALGVPGSEMVAYSFDFGGPLTSQEIEAITTYMRSLEENAVSKPNWRTPLEDENLTGEQLALLTCSRCHGTDLEGLEGLGPDISADSLTMLETDEWITGRIADGFKQMPRFGRTLTDVQIASIVSFLRFGDAPPPPTSTTTTVPGTPTTTLPDVPPDPSNDEVLALGERLYQMDAGVDGCQECHDTDASGTSSGPNIQGSSRSGISSALRDVPDMDFAQKLTNEEIEAVYAYLQFLSSGG